MIRTFLLSSPSERLQHFQEFEQSQHTWIVSNLRSKVELQTQMMQTHGFFIGDSVLRISEFWKTLLAQNFPEKKVISEDLLEFLAEDWIEKNPWCQLQSSSKNLLIQACHQLNDVIFSGEEEVLLQWVEENRPQDRFWFRWMDVCKKFITDAVQNNHCLSARWIPGFLLDAYAQKPHLHLWDKHIYLDVASELHSCEAQLFSRLGPTTDISVLKPIAPEARLFPLLKPYDFIELTENRAPPPIPPVDKLRVLRHETTLGEIQFAVSQIRRWIEVDKVAPSDILVLFANYDLYWQKFQSICNLEGLPLDQNTQIKLLELPLVQRWLSQCWTMGKLLDKDQTFHFLFSAQDSKMSFDEYLQKYSLYDQEHDLEKIPAIQNQMASDQNLSSPLHHMMNIFLNCIQDFPATEDQVLLQKCIQVIWQNLSEFPEQSLTNYKKIVLKILAHADSGISAPLSPHNIQTGQIQSCQIHQGIKRLYLGINQEYFLTSSRIYKAEETKQMNRDLNIYFEDDESSSTEFELYWQSRAQFEETIYNFSGTNFQGDLLSPHHFLTELQHFQKIQPQVCDLAQFPTVYSTLHRDQFSESKKHGMEERLALDEGVKAFQLQQTSSHLLALSATHLQNYNRCPFIYFSQKLLKLKDLPEVDFDIDLMTEGILIHALFENLIRLRQEIWTEEKLNSLLENLKIKLRITTFDDHVWRIAKRRYVQTAFRFLKFEADWSQHQPHCHIVELEKKFEKAVTLMLHDQQIQVVFQGTIDRIECDPQGNIFIVDYKRSTTSHPAPGSWIKDNLLQLLFYGWLVRKYHILDDKTLMGLVHYDYQRMDRDSSLISTNTADFEKFFQDIEISVLDLVSKIVKNQMQPQPLDPADCPQCSWKALCRAPHLNH